MSSEFPFARQTARLTPGVMGRPYPAGQPMLPEENGRRLTPGPFPLDGRTKHLCWLACGMDTFSSLLRFLVLPPVSALPTRAHHARPHDRPRLVTATPGSAKR
jgi:hypothetical protein